MRNVMWWVIFPDNKMALTRKALPQFFRKNAFMVKMVT